MLQNFSQLEPLNFPLTNIMWAILGVMLIICGIISAVLMYHWRSYGMNNRRFVVVEAIYLIVAAVIVVFSITSILLSA